MELRNRSKMPVFRTERSKGTMPSSTNADHSKSFHRKTHMKVFLKTLIFAPVTICFLFLAKLHYRVATDHHNISTSAEERHPTISYEIVQGLEYKNTFDPYYICKGDRYTGPRAATHEIFHQKGISDFHVKITTSLKILIIGDSVGIQFSQALQEATGAHPDDRHVIYHSWRQHEGIHLASPVRGGGAVAGFRITGLLTEKQRENSWQMAPTPGGGWTTSNVTSLMKALANSRGDSTSAGSSAGVDGNTRGGGAMNQENNFDVVVFQFPFGWMEKPTEELFTTESLMDAINTSHAQFGAKTMILQTIPMQNNVLDIKRELIRINSFIYHFARNYVPPSDGTGVQRIVVMDLAWLSFSQFAHNAVGLKLVDDKVLDFLGVRSLESATEVAERLNPLLSARMDCCNKDYQQVMGFSCAEVVDNPGKTKYCKMNTYSLDGIHWCMSTFGGRIHGAFSCLLQCAYEKDLSRQQYIECENRCNDVFMSLQPIAYGNKNTISNY